MKRTLYWAFRVVDRSKLKKIDVFESLSKPLKIWEDIENLKLFILYFEIIKKNSPIAMYIEPSEGLN